MRNYPHLFRKRTVAGFAALLASALPAAAQVDLGLSPMKVEFPVTAGRTFSGTLVLTSGAAGKTRIRAELLDLYVDETTTPQFVLKAPAEAEYSCRAWLSANPMEMEMGPRSTALVRYSIRVPAGASERSYHCALGFRTLAAPTETDGTAMHTAVRMIAVFYPILGKPAISGVIKGVKLEQVPNGPGTLWRVVVIMENSGLMFYRPAGKVDVVDAAGKVVESIELASFPALPKRQQRYVLPLKTSLIPGPYTLRARIEVGSEIQEASVAAEVMP
jgi:hypothetical protein